MFSFFLVCGNSRRAEREPDLAGAFTRAAYLFRFVSFRFRRAVSFTLVPCTFAVYAIENHSFIYSLICMLVVPCYLFPTISNDEIAEYAHT